MSINTHIPALQSKWIQVVYEGNAPGIAGAPALLGTKLTALEIARLQARIDLLIASGDRSPSAMKTLSYLQQRIAMARPEKTQLLANFPNPFNPETWIPYELATDTNVQDHGLQHTRRGDTDVGIGASVCWLLHGSGSGSVLGWSERVGEQVASGIYFFQFETDDMSAMRKMVILK